MTHATARNKPLDTCLKTAEWRIVDHKYFCVLAGGALGDEVYRLRPRRLVGEVVLRQILQRVLANPAILLTLVMQQAAHGQAINGSVVGNVRDASDALIGGAVVGLTNTSTGQ